MTLGEQEGLYLAGRPWYSLAAQEEPVHPEPADHQHDEGDGEAEEEPGAKVDHLCGWILAGGERTRSAIRNRGFACGILGGNKLSAP